MFLLAFKEKSYYEIRSRGFILVCLSISSDVKTTSLSWIIKKVIINVRPRGYIFVCQSILNDVKMTSLSALYFHLVHVLLFFNNIYTMITAAQKQTHRVFRIMSDNFNRFSHVCKQILGALLFSNSCRSEYNQIELMIFHDIQNKNTKKNLSYFQCVHQ